MQSRPIDVFFYGLFMDPDMLRAKGLHPMNGRQARVSGMALRIGRRATLVPDPNKTVYGFVFGLPHQEIDQLYQEPSVAMYRPEAVITRLSNRAFPRSVSICHRPANPKMPIRSMQRNCGPSLVGLGYLPTTSQLSGNRHRPRETSK